MNVAVITPQLNAFTLQMNLSLRFLLLCVVLVTAAISVFAIGMRHQGRNTAGEVQREESELRQTVVAYLVCDYLDTNKNQWPPNWEALKPFHDARFPKVPFDELQRHVTLDFTIDPSRLLETCVNAQLAADFKPIRSKTRGDEAYEQDPNAVILRHVGRIIMY